MTTKKFLIKFFFTQDASYFFWSFWPISAGVGSVWVSMCTPPEYSKYDAAMAIGCDVVFWDSLGYGWISAMCSEKPLFFYRIKILSLEILILAAALTLLTAASVLLASSSSSFSCTYLTDCSLCTLGLIQLLIQRHLPYWLQPRCSWPHPAPHSAVLTLLTAASVLLASSSSSFSCTYLTDCSLGTLGLIQLLIQLYLPYWLQPRYSWPHPAPDSAVLTLLTAASVLLASSSSWFSCTYLTDCSLGALSLIQLLIQLG